MKNDDGSKRENRIKKLTNEPVYPLLVRMAVPSMIGMMVSTVYSMTDTYFVGKLDNVDLTASVGIVFSFVSVIQAIGFWFGYGSGNHISGSLGKRDIGSAERMAATGVLIALLTGNVIVLFGDSAVEGFPELIRCWSRKRNLPRNGSGSVKHTCLIRASGIRSRSRNI